jgi:hypothetical protein
MPAYEEMHGVRTGDGRHPETPVSDEMDDHPSGFAADLDN